MLREGQQEGSGVALVPSIVAWGLLPGLGTGRGAGFQKMLSSVWDAHEFFHVENGAWC